ncbi:hypothetical protein B0T17DRAFT_594016 [Bombardia bombarda]|uniref:Uncharacterized protein n=1 Tax=Bombardia bombarda TaxID=252184 RepID=A0AA39W9N2_9PEZI|nr:hypothetical protein B0T17DRAFT_594016 [Bombardia bombarda]
MGDIGEHGFGISGRNSIPWDGGSLRDSLRTAFTSAKHLVSSNNTLDRLFTAKNITRIGGLNIIWTGNLANHLQVSTNNPLFPAAFLEETLRTLALLFPQNDPKTRHWIATVLPTDTAKSLDPMMLKCGSLRSQDRRFGAFHFWHDRLVILKQVFDDAKPQSLSQWWWDRRNSVQWYTFWVAALVFLFTIFFGVVQSIEGDL